MTQFLVGLAIYWAAGILLALAIARWKDPAGNIKAAMSKHGPGYSAVSLLFAGLLALPLLALGLLVRPLRWFGAAVHWWLGIEKKVLPPCCTCGHSRLEHSSGGRLELAPYCRAHGCRCNLYLEVAETPKAEPANEGFGRSVDAGGTPVSFVQPRTNTRRPN